MRISDWSSDVCSSDLGLQYAYRDRRNKKREFRGLWIQRINAGVREHGLTYSQLISGIRQAGIEIDRKVLPDIAAREPETLKALAVPVKGVLAKGRTAPPRRYRRRGRGPYRHPA